MCTTRPADQVLQAILPEDLLDESPTAFTQVGHIGAWLESLRETRWTDGSAGQPT